MRRQAEQRTQQPRASNDVLVQQQAAGHGAAEYEHGFKPRPELQRRQHKGQRHGRSSLVREAQAQS